MNKKSLTEADIRTKFITPALLGPDGSKWDLMTQLREEVYFTKGRVIVRGKSVRRGEANKADYLLYLKPGLPIALIEAKDNNHALGAGMQQALDYAEILDVPFVYSSNGDAFLEHDRTGQGAVVERELPLDQFPSPDELWQRYAAAKGYTAAQQAIATQDYYDDGSGKAPRYYQTVAINRAVEAIARGEDRILLVMATGTGKTYTAFQIIWRLWKSGARKRILFLVDRNILADQTKTNDFKPFGQAMTKITHRTVDKAFEIYLSLYQAVTGTEDEQNIYRQFADAPTPANLQYLFHPSYAITPDDLRKSILTLAVQGKLVPQDPNDEPANVTFPKLAAVAMEADEDGFPAHWLRVPLGKTGEWRGGGTPSKSRPDFWVGDLPWVSPKDMKVLQISDAQDHISPAAVEGSSVRLIPTGSLLMVVRGMILARAFPVAVTTRKVTINQDMKALLPFEPKTKDYLISDEAQPPVA